MDAQMLQTKSSFAALRISAAGSRSSTPDSLTPAKRLKLSRSAENGFGRDRRAVSGDGDTSSLAKSDFYFRAWRVGCL